MVSLISTHFDQTCSLQVTVGHPVCETPSPFSSLFSFCSVIIDHYPLASVLITSAVSINDVIWVLLLFVSVFFLVP